MLTYARVVLRVFIVTRTQKKSSFNSVNARVIEFLRSDLAKIEIDSKVERAYKSRLIYIQTIRTVRPRYRMI